MIGSMMLMLRRLRSYKSGLISSKNIPVHSKHLLVEFEVYCCCLVAINDESSEEVINSFSSNVAIISYQYSVFILVKLSSLPEFFPQLISDWTKGKVVSINRN